MTSSMMCLSNIWNYLKVVESRSVALVNSSHHPLTIEWPPASRARIRSTDRWALLMFPLIWQTSSNLETPTIFFPSTPSSLINVSTDFATILHFFLPRQIHQAPSFHPMSPLARFDRDVYSRFNATHRCSHEFDNDMSLFSGFDGVMSF